MQTEKNEIRLGVVGLSWRGSFLLGELLGIPGVRPYAMCDLYADRAEGGADIAQRAGFERPPVFADYREMLEKVPLDAVLISCGWTAHLPVARAAMKAGVYVGMEVGGATSVQECFELVRLSEETGVPCMLLENCCYGRDEMAVLNMAKKGVFGEIVHCGCGYLHDLRDEICLGRENRHYRLDNYLCRNGENYPTHGIGPAAKLLGINRGNRFLSLVSFASKARGLQDWVKHRLPADHPLAGRTFNQGDVVTTLLRCANGETVQCTLSTCSPCPYSRAGLVQGTRAMWAEEGRQFHLDGKTPPHEREAFDPYRDEYEHPLWAEYRRLGVHEAGHDGMDYLCLSAFVESVKRGVQPPIDVYDTATWMAITALSEESIALGGAPVAFPDFTSGAWICREPAPESKYALDRVCEGLFQ